MFKLLVPKRFHHDMISDCPRNLSFSPHTSTCVLGVLDSRRPRMGVPVPIGTRDGVGTSHQELASVPKAECAATATLYGFCVGEEVTVRCATRKFQAFSLTIFASRPSFDGGCWDAIIFMTAGRVETRGLEVSRTLEVNAEHCLRTFACANTFRDFTAGVHLGCIHVVVTSFLLLPCRAVELLALCALDLVIINVLASSSGWHPALVRLQVARGTSGRNGRFPLEMEVKLGVFVLNVFQNLCFRWARDVWNCQVCEKGRLVVTLALDGCNTLLGAALDCFGVQVRYVTMNDFKRPIHCGPLLVSVVEAVDDVFLCLSVVTSTSRNLKIRQRIDARLKGRGSFVGFRDLVSVIPILEEVCFTACPICLSCCVELALESTGGRESLCRVRLPFGV